MTYHYNYTPVGDIITMLICLVCIVLQLASYTEDNKHLRMYRFANIMVLISAFTSINFYTMAKNASIYPHYIIYIFKNAMYFCMAATANACCIYLAEIARTGRKRMKVIRIMGYSMLAFVGLFEILTPVTKLGFYIDEANEIHQGFILDVFTIMYVYYGLIIIGIIAFNKIHFITRVRQGMVAILIIVFGIMIVEAFTAQTSFTCFSFVIPMIMGMQMFHSNTYDLDTGTLDRRAFNGYIHDNFKRGPVIFSLKLQQFDEDGLRLITDDIYHFGEKYYRRALSFKISDDRLLLAYVKKSNRNNSTTIADVMEGFNEYYKRLQIDYKVVYMDNIPDGMRGDELLKVLEDIESDMNWSSLYICTDKDFEHHQKNNEITDILKDIHLKHNLNDDRVKVFCQPVYNVTTGKYDTAEALMRIVDPVKGMIFPDVFVPLAEKNDYIHSLSSIILYKTGCEIKKLLAEGYELKRISVNVSSLELRQFDFCEEILEIIQKADIPFEKIALEITESRSEKDYSYANDVMVKLRKAGIVFYLDDFGTGYSNLERLITLPFDIIKFDRSMTILSGKNNEGRELVENLAEVFKKVGYTILFEGVEDMNDQERCCEMYANYLQGYLYSKPIRIEDLRKFLSKVEE